MKKGAVKRTGRLVVLGVGRRGGLFYQICAARGYPEPGTRGQGQRTPQPATNRRRGGIEAGIHSDGEF